MFVDPPYSTHIDYGEDPACIGKLHAGGPEYYRAMEGVLSEIRRVLRPGRHMALYVSDSFEKGKPFMPIGFELFRRMCRLFEPVDIVSVVRHNKKLDLNHWHTAAVEGNFFLRGFNYLFIMRKPEAAAAPPKPPAARPQGKSAGPRPEKAKRPPFSAKRRPPKPGRSGGQG